MGATAVGLFADASVSESVVDALRAHGMPMKSIRVVSWPEDGSGSGKTGKYDGPIVSDFAKTLLNELRMMGASETESLAYLSGVQAGNVLVFLTGSLQQADAASAIMNQYTPYDLEDIPGAPTIAPAVHQFDVEPEGMRTRLRGDGARLFSW